MRARRVFAIASTCAVAIALMVALPVAQLAVARVAVPACCCPSPAQCRCPDHQAAKAAPASVRTCRRAPQTSAPERLPHFPAPVRAVIATPVRAVAIVTIPLPAPHDPPAPDRRPAPS